MQPLHFKKNKYNYYSGSIIFDGDKYSHHFLLNKKRDIQIHDTMILKPKFNIERICLYVSI